MAEEVPAAILAVAMEMVDQLNQRAVEGRSMRRLHIYTATSARHGMQMQDAAQ